MRRDGGCRDVDVCVPDQGGYGNRLGLPEQINVERTLLIDVEKGLLYEADSHDAAGYRAALNEAMKGFVEREAGHPRSGQG